MATVRERRTTSGSTGGMTVRQRRLSNNSGRSDQMMSPTDSSNLRSSIELENNADRADRNLSPVESAKTRSAIQAQDTQASADKAAYDKLPKVRKLIVSAVNSPIGKRIIKGSDTHSDFLRGALKTASLGATHAADKALLNSKLASPSGKAQLQTRIDSADKSTAGKVGEYAGYLVPGAASERLSAFALKPLLKNAPKIVSGLARGAGAGAIFGVADETGQALSGQNNQSLGQRALDVGIQTGAGGVLGAAAPLVKPLFQKGLQGLKSLSRGLGSKMPTSGFSAFAKNVGQKLRRPENPERISDLIDVGGRPNKKDGGSRWEQFYTSIVNEQAPIPRAVKQIGGKDVPFEQDPSKLAWLSRGWKGKADTKLEHGFLDEAGNKVAPALKESIMPIKARLNDLREYAVALRSLEYGDLQSGVPKDLAESTIQKYANDDELKKAYDGLKQYIDNEKKSTLVDSGIWSEAKQQFYKETQPNYMPMFRTKEKGLRDGIQGKGAKGFGNVKDPTKKRTGSSSPIVDPIESVIKQTYVNQALAERNNVMRSFVELAEKNPDNAIMKPAKGSSALDEVHKSLDEFINNPTDDMEKRLTEALDLFKPQTVNGERNVFTVMRGGKAEQWQVTDDSLAKVLAGLGNEPSNPLINMVGKATGVLKAGLVLAPDFVVKNLVRDQMSAFINSKYGFIPLWDTVSGLISAARKDDAFYKWMGSGGANGAWVSLERDYLQGQIRNLTQSNIRKMGNPVEVMRKLSEWSEQGTRIGEFKRGLKSGASLKEAALASRDVTLDFSRIGSKTKSANKAIAFFNVAVQSVDKMARQFADRPVATPIKAVTAITLPSIVLYLLNHNNPRYQELPQWEKDSNWHFYMKGQEQPIRVPKPFEMGTVFGTFFERMMRDVKDKDPEAFEGFAKQALDGFTPSIIPTLITPWIEAYSNKDMFTKAPIIPKREDGFLPEDQYGPYTSEISKKVGNVAGTSGRIVENYVTGYTGTLGRYGLQAADKLYTKLKDIKTPARPDGGAADKPVLRSFVSKGLEGASKSVDDFYKEKDRLTKERNSSRKHEAVYEEEMKFKSFNKISEQIGKHQAEIRAVMEDMQMNSQQKRDKIRDLNLSIINLARGAKELKPIDAQR